jgi:hypothetical protein
MPSCTVKPACSYEELDDESRKWISQLRAKDSAKKEEERMKIG